MTALGVLMVAMLVNDTYVSMTQGYVRLGRQGERKHFRTDGPRLFWVNVCLNALMGLGSIAAIIYFWTIY